METPSTAFDTNQKLVRHEIAVLVFVIAIVALVIAGGAAIFCMARGGNLQWTQYFLTVVKVACKFH